MLSKKTKFIISALQRLKINEKADYLSKNRNRTFHVPKLLFSDCTIKNWEHDDTKLISLEHEDSASKREIIYLHGGAYAVGVKPYHFYLMYDLSKALNGRITLIDYPLAPEFNVEMIFPKVLEAYKSIVEVSGDKELILIGDSAGGGMALALSMYLRDMEDLVYFPKKIVLYSPWLDVTLSNPEIEIYEKNDFVLNKKALQDIGRVYAGSLNLKDYLISPLYGNLNHLGEIGIFYGSGELFFPDCKYFCDQSNLIGTKIKDFEYEHMPHDWIIMPIEERAEALKETRQFVTGTIE